MLRRVKFLLCRQHRQIAVRPHPVPRLRQVIAPLLRFYQLLLPRHLCIQKRLRRQPVRHLPERRLDRLLVIGHLDLLIQLRDLQIRLVLSRRKDRHRDLRIEQPRSRARREQARQLRTRHPRIRRDLDRRQKRRPRRPDICVRRLQLMLRLPDVRSPQQQIRRQPRRQIPDHPLLFQRPPLRQLRRQVPAHQQHQRMLRLTPLLFIARHTHPRRRHLRLRRSQVQLRRIARIITPPVQIVSLLHRFQCAVRHPQLLVQLHPSEILLRHRRHQRHLRVHPRLPRRKILFQRLRLQAPHPPEQIQFIRCRPHSQAVLVVHCVLALKQLVRRRPLPRETPRPVDLR